MAMNFSEKESKRRVREVTKLRSEALCERKVAAAIPAAMLQSVAEHKLNAAMNELVADQLAALPPLFEISCGEAIPDENERPDYQGGYRIRNTMQSPDVLAIEASLQRTELLTEGNTDVLAIAIDAAESIGSSSNSLEKMLAHQMALAHKSTFKLMDRAMSERDSVEQARLVNASVRLMTVYQQGLLTLQRLRTGGKQVMTVQHVSVGQGGQAIIGSVNAGAPPSSNRGVT